MEVSHTRTILVRILPRAIAHGVLGILLLLLTPILIPTFFYPIVGALALVFLVARQVSRSNIFHHARTHSYGEFFFLAGIALSYLLFMSHPDAWYVALLTLTFADTAGSVVGSVLGKHIYMVYDERRSMEGTVACILVSTLILFIFNATIPYAIAGGVLIGLLENITIRGSDNPVLPVVAGCLVLVFA